MRCSCVARSMRKGLNVADCVCFRCARRPQNIGTCTVPKSVDVQGLTIPLTCLWPGHA
jgi:hypothetical protein